MVVEFQQIVVVHGCIFFFSSRRRHTRLQGDWSSDVCSSDLHSCITGTYHLAHAARSQFSIVIPGMRMKWRKLCVTQTASSSLLPLPRAPGSAADRKSVV